MSQYAALSVWRLTSPTAQVIATFLICLGLPLHAAAAAVPPSSIEEITVTARRVQESTQTVPMTVTAVVPDILKKENITRPTELTYTVPSLSIAPSFNTLNNGYSVRGLAAGVATYFAEASCCTGNGSIPFMDIGLVQVLNGPQGTLFGRTSGSGAILIEPVRPHLDEDSYSFSGRFGDYGRRELTVTADVPVIADQLGVRVAANTTLLDGFTRQIGRKQRLDGQDNQQIRLGVLFNQGRFENYLVGNYIALNQSASNEVLAAINTSIGTYNLPASTTILNTACAGAVSIGLNPDVASCVTQRLAMLANQKAALTSEMNRINTGGDDAVRLTPGAVIDQPTFLELENWSVLNVARFDDIEVGPLKVSITDLVSYESIVNNTGNPADGIGGAAEQAGAFNTAGVGANNTRRGRVVAQLGPPTKIATNDLKVSAEGFDGLLTSTVGYFISHSKSPATNKGTGNIYQIFGGVLSPDLGYLSALDFSAGSDSGQRAWYTQTTLDLSAIGIHGLSVTGGYRKTWDKARVTGHPAVFRLATTTPATPASWVGDFTPGTALNVSQTKSDGYNYLFSVTEQFTPDFMMYATLSRAYIPGGVNRNIQGSQNLPNYKPIWDPQVVLSYELGAKVDFRIGDMPARLNTSVYYYDFTDIAVGFSGFTGTASVGYTANVAEAELKGLEMSGAIKPTDAWEISVGYNYNDAEYTKWTASDPHNAARPGDAICSPSSQQGTCLIDLTNNPFFRMPRNQGHVTVAYYPQIDNAQGELYLSASLYAQSLVWYNSSAKRLLQVLPTAKPGISQDAYHILNLRADWSDILGSGFDVAAFVNNATDEVYKIGATPQLLTLGFSIATYGPPRMVGFEVSKKF